MRVRRRQTTVERWRYEGAFFTVVYALDLKGPMTLEQLAGWLRLDQYRVHKWLDKLARKGEVELIERGAHRNRRGMKCGKWAVIK